MTGWLGWDRSLTLWWELERSSLSPRDSFHDAALKTMAIASKRFGDPVAMKAVGCAWQAVGVLGEKELADQWSVHCTCDPTKDRECAPPPEAGSPEPPSGACKLTGTWTAYLGFTHYEGVPQEEAKTLTVVVTDGGPGKDTPDECFHASSFPCRKLLGTYDYNGGSFVVFSDETERGFFKGYRTEGGPRANCASNRGWLELFVNEDCTAIRGTEYCDDESGNATGSWDLER
jgi:hypothetical protein